MYFRIPESTAMQIADIQSTMSSIQVKRTDLIEALTKNMDRHRENFLEAQKGYRAAMIKELDQMLTDARAGNKIRRQISLPEPEDHTAEYNTAIRMLEMCVDDKIQISSLEFQQLVMDDWGWKKHWTDTVSNYVGAMK
jgi:hypothetical protein